MPNTGLVPLLRRTYWISLVTTGVTAATVIATAIAQHDRDRWTRHSREVVRMARAAQLFALDRETGVRGYLLTGDSASLAPDLAARTPLRATLDSLIAATADNPSQERRAQGFATAIAHWDSSFAEPAIRRRAAPGPSGNGTMFDAAGLGGERLFDEIRSRFDEFETEEERLYRDRESARSWLQSLNVAVTVIGLTLLVLVQAALRRRVIRLADGLVERQTLLEDQATELEEQAAQLEEQSFELQTQSRELSETVQELERKNEDLNAFSASVAHDLRSPLRSIDGFSHLLLTEERQHLTPDGVKALERIRTNTRRMGELIDGLLSLARVSASDLRRSTVNLSDLATSVAAELRRQLPAGRALDVVVQPGLAAQGDARLLRIAMTNLLDNAMKFTRSRADARIEVGAKSIDDRATFFVADNGAGFDMEYADKLFAPFERLHDDPQYEGTGIGLATVRRIIERHGGTLRAESEPDRGATFYFTLPG